MENVKDHFEDEARNFDRLIRALIPQYETMIRILVDALPFDRSSSVRIIDLGCGTGAVAAKLLEVFPNAHVTCLDLAENMIAVARERLGHLSRVDFIVADFSDYKLMSRYDAAVSSLALHHLESDIDKMNLYRRLFDCIHPGGVFYNADVVLASSDYLESINRSEWIRFMSLSLSMEEIEGTWLPKAREEDHPARLTDHLRWLAEAGFIDGDVIWKHYGFAVYGGKRPRTGENHGLQIRD